MLDPAEAIMVWDPRVFQYIKFPFIFITGSISWRTQQMYPGFDRQKVQH